MSLRKISSRTTFFQKRVFPVIWFGFLGIFAATAVFGTFAKKNGPPLPFLLVPLLMAGFGFMLFKKLLFDLADEVYDCGDFLLVRKGGREDRVLLSNIRNVGYSTMTNPSRVTLSLREKGPLGAEISFIPIRVFTWDFLAPSPIVTELIDRIDRARTA